MTTKPYPYQRGGVRKIERFAGRALLADEMGLGKTLQVLLWMKNFLEQWPAVIVCPASMKIHWEREAAKHIGMRCHIIEGRTPPKKGLPKADIYIINYEILDKWIPLLKKLEFGLVATDECHYISNRRAKRTKWVRKLAEWCPYFIGISGTPLTNRPSELWSILNLIRPDLYNSYFSFIMRYTKFEKTPWGVQFKGAKRLKELHSLLKSNLMIRRLKKHVMSQLPKKSRNVVTMPITNRKEYEEASKNLVKWLLKHGRKRSAIAAKNAEYLVRWGHLLRLTAQLKMPAIRDWIKNFLAESDDKLILFGVHKAILLPLKEEFKKICVHVDGSVTGQKRQDAIDRFNQDKRCRLFIGNIKAAGVGWSCRSASAVAFIELDWKPGTHIQAEDRIHGIGRGLKDKVATCYYLVAQNTVESHLCKVLQSKQKILDQTLDGDRSSGGLDVFSQLEDLLLGRK